MSELITISKVASFMNISSRSIRYWESAGLFKSSRDVESGWRLYDEEAIKSIRITELLRRLDIPIIDIKEILDNKTADNACQVLQKQLNKLGKMGSDLNTRREAISELINVLNEESLFLLDALENVLPLVSLNRKRANVTKIKKGINMKENILRNEIQIIELMPMRAIAYSCVSIEPENEACNKVLEWIKTKNLLGTMRLFGFNVEPYPTEDNPAYGFGYCATIPEGIEIPETLYEMKLPGGTYVAISQYDGDPSQGWAKAQELLADQEFEWEYDVDRNPGLEEHISRGDQKGYYVTILLPVRKKL